MICVRRKTYPGLPTPARMGQSADGGCTVSYGVVLRCLSEIKRPSDGFSGLREPAFLATRKHMQPPTAVIYTAATWRLRLPAEDCPTAADSTLGQLKEDDVTSFTWLPDELQSGETTAATLKTSMSGRRRAVFG